MTATMTRRGVLALVTVLALFLAACTGSSSPQGAELSTSKPGSPDTGGPSPFNTSSGGSTAPTALRRVELSHLDGATVARRFVLVDDTSGVTEAKFYLTTQGTVFLATVKDAPFESSVAAGPGTNSVQVRHEIGGDISKISATFTVSGAAGSGASSDSGAVTHSAPAEPATPVAQPAATVTVSTSEQLTTALNHAGPGTVIRLLDGEYPNRNGTRWHLAASGTADRPITIEGDRQAFLESDSPHGDYGLWITGSYWQVLGLTVRNASKGIVLDGSQHTVLDDVEVYNVGDEGVHFRSCSSDDTLQRSYLHDTGVQAPSFGEGVYVGSANSNWSKYNCNDGRDNSERNVIRDNVFRHTPAEGADLKEGTDSGTLSGNTFVMTGFSGKNSADSAVDAKGSNWVITANTVGDPVGADLDAFQSHTVAPGYGTGNMFSSNTINGKWPGFGIAFYPAAGNVATCDNVAPDAVAGLVGANKKPIACVH